MDSAALTLNGGAAFLILVSGCAVCRTHDGALGSINPATTSASPRAYGRKGERKLDNGNQTRSDQQARSPFNFPTDRGDYVGPDGTPPVEKLLNAFRRGSTF